MRTFVVGDIQGCCSALERLLESVAFDTARDELWCVGDLINRGPDSLGTLKLLVSLGDRVKTVLGNHDLHFLATVYGARPSKPKDTFDALMAAPERDELVHWLRHQPLLHHDPQRGVVMVHAGIAPQWSLVEAEGYAREVEVVLTGPHLVEFLAGMYGQEPDLFTEDLTGPVRWRVITNVFTRMRYLSPEGRLELESTCHPSDAPAGLVPWFDYPRKQPVGAQIFFGHWASLRGELQRSDAVALDTGCVWGQELTMVCLETGARSSCPCPR